MLARPDRLEARRALLAGLTRRLTGRGTDSAEVQRIDIDDEVYRTAAEKFKAIIADIEETQRSILKAMQDAERMAGAQVESVYAGIAGELMPWAERHGVAADRGNDRQLRRRACWAAAPATLTTLRRGLSCWPDPSAHCRSWTFSAPRPSERTAICPPFIEAGGLPI